MEKRTTPFNHLAAAASIPLSTPGTTAMIRLKDALELLDGAVPVAVRWVKCDVRRKTAGELGHLPAGRIGRGTRTATAPLRAPTETEETAAHRAAAWNGEQVLVPTGTKDPAHWLNATRNLVDTRTGLLVKIHIYLLTHVAGRKVYL